MDMRILNLNVNSKTLKILRNVFLISEFLALGNIPWAPGEEMLSSVLSVSQS